MIDREEEGKTVPCATPAEQELVRIASGYFRSPDADGLELLKRQILARHGDPTRNAALVIQAANDALDAECREVAAILASQGKSIVCGPGCSGCCFQLVLCHPFEAALIGMHIRSRPELQAFFQASWRAWDTATAGFRASYLAWAEKYYRDGKDDGTHHLLDYFLPCPFLDKDHCRIYPVRPYACRSCVAVSEACRHPENGGKPGMHTLELGAYTPHKQARQAAVKLLWESFGVSPGDARADMMPALVHRWLNISAGGDMLAGFPGNAGTE